MISSTSLNGIRIFVATVENGNYSKAAEKLNLSKSAVSKAMTNLEERLRVTLFQRTTRSLKLTEEGRIYYESCVKALGELSEAEESLLLQKQNLSGTVRLNLPVLFGKKWILPILLDLADAHPQIHFEVSFSNTAMNLIEDEIDLAVRIGTLPDSSTLTAKLIGHQGVTTCASPAYLKKSGTPKSIEDLKDHRCITDRGAKGPSNWLFKTSTGKTLRITNKDKIKSTLSFEGSDTCMQAALANQGITQLPTWLAADNLKSGKLIAVLESQKANLPINALWPKTQNKTHKKVRIIIDELLKRLANTSF